MKNSLARWLIIVTLLLLLLPLAPISAFAPPVSAQAPPPPEIVAIPGTIQSKAGCAGDWQPTCDKTFLTYDAEDDVWQGSFELPAGSYEYKTALDGSWDVNYGLNATPSGSNITLNLSEGGVVKFYYDHKTHWVTDNRNSVIAVLVGDIQQPLGCAADNDPGCLRSWLQDLTGSGMYTFVTTGLAAGDYEVRIAINESLDEVYGANGARDGAPVVFTVPADGAELYFGFDAATRRLIISTEGAPRGNLEKAQAHWVSRDTLLWNVPDKPGNTYRLHTNPQGALRLGIGVVEGGASVPLTTGSADDAVRARFPHLARYTALKLAAADLALIPEMLRGHVAVSAWDADGKLLDATSVQLPGVLDDLFTYDGPLGVVYTGDTPSLHVWAPTARSVTLQLFSDSNPATAAVTYPMTSDPATGVWSVTGTPDWTAQFYLYEVEVYAPSTGAIERNLVTDPYSFSLALNSTRSQIVNLDAPALQPPGWETLAKPPLAAFEDIVLYELHVRDFSMSDPAVPEAYRGTFKAFTVADSYGMTHLRALADAGLTHIHLLPAFDIASINEDRSAWAGPTFEELAAYPPDSEAQQAALQPTRDQDGFNWGYDPFHYTVPEGSYSTNPDGVDRIVEFREMVQALNTAGLRVVLDVVYNHTNASGQSAKSVLDKVVPGYYHRLNADGFVERSTCCENTATEHAMMEKLMIDSAVTWARAYKVDGFRFDLMGHHMLGNMIRVRETLDALTLERDGVDGRSIYVYGEGWNFGEVADNRRGVNATQLNIAETGIGAFNDRLRDGARGGGPFSGLQEQGFATGLYYAPNATESRSEAQQRERLIEYMYWIRVGLAGSLRNYEMLNAAGFPAKGTNIFYNTAPAGYTLDPQETINYVSAHDNETLFDAIQLKAPAEATLAERVRMNNLAVSLVMYGQGVPFFHAGDDMLRSKSMDRNTYNSGDWFNRLDFTYQSNNWGAGLPPAGENQRNWPVMQPLLADPALQPAPADILDAVTYFQEVLRIRKSSRLFRMETAEDIQQRLHLLNTGPEQLPGLIVMALADDAPEELDPDYGMIVVLFNGADAAQTFSASWLQQADFALHPIQAESADPVVREARFDAAAGSFTVPGYTTAVFVSAAAPEVTDAPLVTPEPPVAPTEAPKPIPTSTPPPVVDEPAESASALPWVVGGLGLAALGGAYLWWKRRTHGGGQ